MYQWRRTKWETAFSLAIILGIVLAWTNSRKEQT